MTQTQALDSARNANGGYKVDATRGSRVGRVSSEWFSRPADERYLSLSALYHAVIRYVIPWRLSVRLFPKGDGVMVSPSGTRGAGSTKVRAGRR